MLTDERMMAEIRDANLSYLILAQSLIRKDPVQALYRLGISEETAELVDREVRRVIQEAYDRAKQVLTEQLVLLHEVATALLERETLTREDIEMLNRGEKLPPRSSGVPPTAQPVGAGAAQAVEPKRATPPLLGGPEPSPA